MSPFTGTWRLVRLALRLDRIKLPVWIFGITLMIGTSAIALGDLYNTVEERTQYAATTAPSVIGRAFGGPIDGPQLGSITMVEVFYFTSVLIAFMSTLAIVRHTRLNEESGASELVGSGIVGRLAPLTAATTVAAGANIVVGLFSFVMLSQLSALSLIGSAGLSAALALVGMAFAGIAAIAAQASSTSRGANSMAGSAIGLAFLIRAVGDGFGTVAPDGLSAEPFWISWLSPMAWGFQIHPYTQQNWWLLGLLAGFAVLMVSASFLLLRRRDVGEGLLPSRLGRANAKQKLLSPLGLAWRLQRGTLIGWGIGFVIFGGIIGGMANEFAELFGSNSDAAEILAALGGGSDNIVDVFFGAMFGFGAITAAGYALQSTLKMRHEENAGHIESVLGASVSRIKWAMSHIFISLLGTVIIMLLLGLAAGVMHVLLNDLGWSEVWHLVNASFVQVPAVYAFIGAVIALFGLLPRWTTPLAWTGFVGGFFIYQLAALLELPIWVINISPFSHLPSVPAESFSITPVIWLLSVGVLLALAGLAGFNRRDITTT